MPGTEEVLRREITERINAKDMAGLDGVAWQCGLAGLTGEYERIANEVLQLADHDIQQFWLGVCNCQGQLS